MKHNYPRGCFEGLLVVVGARNVAHQFSSRYAAMASPVLVVASGRYAQDSSAQTIRLFVGVCIDALSLASYLILP